MNLLELITKNAQCAGSDMGPHVENWCRHEMLQSLFKKTRKLWIKFFELKPGLTHDMVRGLLLRSGMRGVVKQVGKYWPNHPQGDGVIQVSFHWAE